MKASLLIAAAGAGSLLSGAPAHRQIPTTAGVVASDFQWNASGGGPATVTITAGGTVDFSYPSGKSTHNVVFTSMQPSSCSQTAGTPSTGALPPLPDPNAAGGAGWAGRCVFNAPGTYAFVCGLHGGMTGSVMVIDAGGPSRHPRRR